MFKIFNDVLEFMFSIILRMELETNYNYLFSIDLSQLYNVYLTVHGIIVIRFKQCM